MVRFGTAPDPVAYVQDKGFRERIGAVWNRTLCVNLVIFKCERPSLVP